MKGRLVSKPWRCAVARTGLAVSRWYSKPAARTEAGISGRPATPLVGRICSWRVAQLPYRTSNYPLLPPGGQICQGSLQFTHSTFASLRVLHLGTQGGSSCMLGASLICPGE